MTRDYIDRPPMLRIMDNYLRHSIEIAGEYMSTVRQVRALELLGLVDMPQMLDAYHIAALCQIEAARSLVGQAYMHHLIDVEDYYAINRMLNKFGISDLEGVR